MKREEKVKNQFLWKETQKKRKGFLVISFSLPFHLTWDEAATWYARYNARCTKICHQSAALKVPPEKYMAFFIFIFLTNIRVHPQHFLWAQYPIFLLSFYVLLFMTDDDCFFLRSFFSVNNAHGRALTTLISDYFSMQPLQGQERKNVFVAVFFSSSSPSFFRTIVFFAVFFKTGAGDNLPPNFGESRSRTTCCLILGPAPKTIFLYRFSSFFFSVSFSSGFSFTLPSPLLFLSNIPKQFAKVATIPWLDWLNEWISMSKAVKTPERFLSIRHRFFLEGMGS